MLTWAGRVQAGEAIQLQYQLGVEGTVPPGAIISNTAMLGWGEQQMQLGPITTAITLPHGILALGPNQPGQVYHRYGVTLTVPPYAITDTTRLQIGPLCTDTMPSNPPPGLLFAHRAFEINAFCFGEPVTQFQQPLSITLSFADVPGFKQETVHVWTRPGAEGFWARLDEPARAMPGGFVFTTTHLSQFALFGEGKFQVFLPLIAR
jgi:hypothetical protein